MENEEYYTIIKFRMSCPTKDAGKVKIWKTYGDHIWGSPIYELVGYADSFKEAQAIARKAREE